MASTGKWLDPNVPKREWSCTGITDLGRNNRATCEMCEVQQIRYVHHMEHLQYDEPLDVGCICAGYMEENPDAARRRETDLKSRNAKEQRRAARAAAWAAREEQRQAAEAQWRKANASLCTILTALRHAIGCPTLSPWESEFTGDVVERYTYDSELSLKQKAKAVAIVEKAIRYFNRNP